MNKAELIQRLNALRPPNRQWAIAECVVVALATFGIVLGALTPPAAIASADSLGTGDLLIPVSAESREQLLTRFTGTRTKPSDRAMILSEIARSIDDRGMILKSRTLETTPEKYPPREVHRLIVSGKAAAHIDFLRELSGSKHAIRVTDVVWSCGNSADSRTLQIVLELLTE